MPYLNDDLSLRLMKALKAGFFPPVLDSEINILRVEAQNILYDDIGFNYGNQNITGAFGRMQAAFANRDIAPVVIVGVGSSTTAGNNATVPEKRYFNRLMKLFQAAYPLSTGAQSPATRSLAEAVALAPSLPGLQGVNAGVGGTTSADYMTSTTRPQIAALAPRVIIHMVGSNDFSAQMQIATFKANLKTQYDAIKTNLGVNADKCIHVFVQAYERYDNFGTINTGRKWQDYGKAMAEFVNERSADCAFIDISPTYYQIGVPSTDPFDVIDTDLIHQKDAGHALMADLIRQGMGIPAGSIDPVKYPIFTSDTFSGADTPNIEGRTSDAALGGTGKLWVTTTPANASLQIVSNTLRIGANTAATFAGFQMSAVDQAISTKIIALGSALDMHLVVRRTSHAVNTSYRLAFNTSTAFLQKMVAGAATNMGSSFTVAVNDTVELRAIGNTISVLKNGALVVEVTDPSFLNQVGWAGISHTSTTGFQWDDVIVRQSLT